METELDIIIDTKTNGVAIKVKAKFSYMKLIILHILFLLMNLLMSSLNITLSSLYLLLNLFVSIIPLLFPLMIL